MNKNCLFCMSSKMKDINNLCCDIYGIINLQNTNKAENCEYFEEDTDDF